MAQGAIDHALIKDKIREIVQQQDNINDITVRDVIEHLERVLQASIKDHQDLMSQVIEEVTKFIEEEWKPRLKELVSKKCSECEVFPYGKLRNHTNSFKYSPLGCVVVGYGNAGAARVRDLALLPSHFALKGIVSKRKLNADLPQRTWEDVLEDASVEAVIITSENTYHAELAAKALEHNKHVLVEYPLTCSFQEAAKLYELAHQKNRVLHVEYIGNLMESHIRLKNNLREQVLKEGTVHFTGGISRLISTDHKLSGFPSFAGIMRLKKLTDLFGEMKLHSASIEYFTEKLPQESTNDANTRTTGFKMTAVLEAISHPNSKITWTEDRQPSNKRGSTFKFVFADGKVVDTEPAGWQACGLFMMDLCQFVHEVRGERKEELAGNEKWTLHCTQIADEIEKKAKQNTTYTPVNFIDSISLQTQNK